jgi:hypothetical protein
MFFNLRCCCPCPGGTAGFPNVCSCLPSSFDVLVQTTLTITVGTVTIVYNPATKQWTGCNVVGPAGGQGCTAGSTPMWLALQGSTASNSWVLSSTVINYVPGGTRNCVPPTGMFDCTTTSVSSPYSFHTLTNSQTMSCGTTPRTVTFGGIWFGIGGFVILTVPPP